MTWYRKNASPAEQLWTWAPPLPVALIPWTVFLGCALCVPTLPHLSLSDAKPVVCQGLRLCHCPARNACQRPTAIHPFFSLTEFWVWGATKGPGQLNVCSFPGCFTLAVGQCSEQVSPEVYGQEVWESADTIWSDIKGPARLAGPLPSSLPSSIFYQDSHLLLSSRIARWGSRMKEATHQGRQMEHSKELVPPMASWSPYE